MKTLYLDLVSGISGDMFLGALIHLGLDSGQLTSELQKLPVGGYRLDVVQTKRSGLEGVKLDVHLEHHHGHHGHGHGHHEHEHGRNFAQIQDLISKSELSGWVKSTAIAIFSRIAVAEGKIHGLPPEQVHFHEVGALDSIVDIVGACIGLELLGTPRILASQVVDGTGWIHCAHGRLPVPAPAVLEILAARGIPFSQCDEPSELITPTGAALLAELVTEFGPIAELRPERIGFGFGTREGKTRPNLLRVILGQAAAKPIHDWDYDKVAILETNLDDVTPEILGHAVEKALAAGALDAFHTPVQMKKNRPGVLLTVLTSVEQKEQFMEWILRETSAFGVRSTIAERRKLKREFATVETTFGSVQIKLGKLDGKIVQAAPEFESCRAIAHQKNLPVRTVYQAAIAAAENVFSLRNS